MSLLLTGLRRVLQQIEAVNLHLLDKAMALLRATDEKSPAEAGPLSGIKERTESC
jgi:hypothetical protein